MRSIDHSPFFRALRLVGFAGLSLGTSLVGCREEDTEDARAECRALAEDIAVACGGQEDRECEWQQLAMVCEREDPEALAAGMRCILDASQDGSCRTFSDPSGARSCLDAELGARASREERALAQTIADRCQGADPDALLVASTLPLAALSPESVESLSGCVEAASSCEAVQACFQDDLAPIAACYAAAPPSSPAQMECEQTVSALAASCGGQADRTCHWQAYAALCASERAEALSAGMERLLAESNGSCRTFSDPSGARECAAEALAPFAGTEARELAASLAALCAVDAEDLLFRAEPPIAALSDASIASTAECVRGATSCDDVRPCFEALMAPISACYE